MLVFRTALKKVNLIFVLRSFTRQVFTKYGVDLGITMFECGFDGLFDVVL